MRARLSALGFCASAAVLAACGGGAGSPAPSGPAATPTPAFENRPAAAGDAFVYAGTMTQTFVRAPLPSGAITPAPNPTNSSTITTAVAQSVSVSQPASYESLVHPYDFHTVETDTINGGLETSTVTTDDYYDYATDGGTTDIYLKDVNAVTSDGVTFTTAYGTGNGLVDIEPEKTGAFTPANNAAETSTELDPDGTTSTRNTYGIGTYTINGTNADSTTTTGYLDIDGSGGYAFPFLGPIDTAYTVAAPVPNPSGGPDLIGITVSYPAAVVEAAPSPNATPVVVSGAVDAWYPVPLVIAQQTLTDQGPTALPAACAVPSSLAKTANAIVESATTIDPVFGEIDVTTQTDYTEEHVGVACVTLNDVLTQYYDLSGQTQGPIEGIFSFAASPFQTTTTTETLGITQASVAAAIARGTPGTLGLRASSAPFRAALAKRRTLRRQQLVRALEARSREVVR